VALRHAPSAEVAPSVYTFNPSDNQAYRRVEIKYEGRSDVTATRMRNRQWSLGATGSTTLPPPSGRHSTKPPYTERQAEPDPVREALRTLRTEEMTPLQALNLLSELKAKLGDPRS
jgi:hypothetical protein